MNPSMRSFALVALLFSALPLGCEAAHPPTARCATSPARAARSNLFLPPLPLQGLPGVVASLRSAASPNAGARGR